MATNGAVKEPEILRPEMNENGLYEIESLCMNCRDDGMTRILPIKIPHFKEVLLESFSCDHCGFKNNTVKSAGEIQPKGSKYSFRLQQQADFERQVIRSDHGTFKIEDIDLEMPPAPGQYTTLESMFSKVLTDLRYDQPTRKEQTPEVYQALEGIITKLTSMLEGNGFPISVTLDDISGNSFITPSTDDRGDKYIRTDYVRSHEQNVQLGLAVEDDAEPAERDAMADVNIVDGEVYEIPAECPACTKPCTVNMKKVNIPHFKDVIVMATVCEHCGYKTNDIKTGGAVPEKGQKITLRIENEIDLSRDILKSETCELQSSDLGLEVQPGTLGGRFTTVEGLLTQVRDQLHGQIFDDVEDGEGLKPGDSMAGETKTRWDTFFDKLDRALKAEFPFSITLADPLANSFVQKKTDGDAPDPQITIEDYERTEEEMDDLGLNDMKTENYHEDD
ncbi:nucleolar zinc-finger protein [Exophiala xenobiotica]|uniref:Nucleolar zinc-finger protein n=1 Tax=Lithohypha guttulata TaxID=1690604 RepID=A0ABR0K6P9_9EURO|nr:nucleolar zinc-finger protein [Lithohypha guttulata]KAK5315597.1 nucleolar zinc-finger protein [Exophiala xenobiotica]